MRTISNFKILQRPYSKKILQIKTIDKILPEIKENSIVFFDVDETIIIPETQFIYGIPHSDQFIKKLKKDFSPEKVVKILKKMEEEYYQSEVNFVEEDVLNVLTDLKYKSYCEIFGVTSRGWYDSHTQKFLKNLSNLKVGFSSSIPDYQTLKVNFHNGILFVNHQNKGEILKEFLEKNFKTTNQKFYFIDDLMENCLNVYHSFEYTDYQFQIFHYIGSHSKINNTEMEKELKRIMKLLSLEI